MTMGHLIRSRSIIVVTVLVCGFSTLLVDGSEFHAEWDGPNRTWIGPAFWANRLQDWQVRDGRLECHLATKRLALRTVHVVTHRLEGRGSFGCTLTTGVIDRDQLVPDAATGLLIGVGNGELDYRAASIVHHHMGVGSGIWIRIDGSGRLVLFDTESGKNLAPESDDDDARFDFRAPIELAVAIIDGDDNEATIEVNATSADQTQAGSWSVAQDRLRGNIAVTSHPGDGAARFWFSGWRMEGERLAEHLLDKVGPIISAQHTVTNNGVDHGMMSMTAQLMPLPEPSDQNQVEGDRVTLLIQDGPDFRVAATAPILRPGFTATFHLDGWDTTRDIPYRLVYGTASNTDDSSAVRQGTLTNGSWTGTIRKEPDRPEVIVAGFTGNHNNARNLHVAGQTNWVEGMWFPHQQIVDHVSYHKPDLLFFSGDQVYEGNSPSFADTAHIELDYLYKWYLWCWAYRELTRDIPTVCLPDDHDVYQGNVWGQGGRRSPRRDHDGGYVHPARFVRMVERTQLGNLPLPYHPETIEQDISMAHTNITYGRVSFAVIEDRKFKSGCRRPEMPPSKTGRPDHFNDPDFDTRDLDLPGLSLLGQQQLDFLEAWSADWRGCDLKMVLSQTTFANLATHHGPQLTRLLADLDSNGWPQSGRDRALAAMRKGFALHLCGDQHLATVAHHGIVNHGDACWSFCVPSIANFYPRAFAPENFGAYKYPKPESFMGRRRDGLGNLIEVVAATNPGRSTGRHPAALHDGMPGYGIVRVDRPNRRYVIECWPRGVDPRRQDAAPYEGWPVTIAQRDNYAREPLGHLPTIESVGLWDPVIVVTDELTSTPIYALRIVGSTFRPPIFATGTYMVEVGEPGTDNMKTLHGVRPTDDPDARQVVQFD